jgi:hypothetical protein
VLQHFTWKAKARQIQEIYSWACGQAEKPVFGMPLPDLQPQHVHELEARGTTRDQNLGTRESIVA